MPLSDRIPTHTRRFTEISDADVGGIGRILTARGSTENRGQLDLWGEISHVDGERVVWLESAGQEEVSVQVGQAGEIRKLNLYDSGALSTLFGAGPILIDISGLPHHVWAPLLKAASDASVDVQVLYAEPSTYKEHPSPSSTSYFDLSVNFGGLAPLPGFARLSGPPDESKCLFVALLGFEGNRPSYLAVQVDPLPKVIPVVGVPGFQMEYPAVTVACNRDFLDAYRAYDEIRLARASCPFEVVAQLREMHRDYPDHYMYIAPVGTKPHALGAVLYALEQPELTEIMFDHPLRKVGRTSGVGLIHLYELRALGTA